MVADVLRSDILAVLTRIAPEVEPADIADDQPLRDQVDLDSMDWLRFLVGIHERFGVDIPEKDYGALRTISDVAAYLKTRVAPGPR
ncbi:acyl carrier protein [Mycolicibacterium goodii]|uniref:acyl carrier protein n=1 Tax=Mycolicibacterium goodii TaxID=134601 RepID=UPI001BDC4B43|nr:acyl carrier protein [Mycolicibacterium goodii]MBU8811382.1 acyl carrier protein [Mycolicibacterium goodii]ULN45435.1 acyl carrier protein [Mycolicibacterium goodii]